MEILHMKELILLIINVKQYHSAPTQINFAAILPTPERYEK